MKKRVWIVAIVITVLCAAVVAVIAGNEKQPPVKENMAGIEAAQDAPTDGTEKAAEDETSTNIEMELAYGVSIRFPDEYADMVEHTQEIYKEQLTEAFVLKNGANDISLYRLDFGARESGDWLGILKTEEGYIPVTYTVFGLSEEALAQLDDSTRECYSVLMECFNQTLRSITADPRFTAEKPLEVGEDTEVKTTYWTLTLPGNMSVVESNENGTYVATFYGEVVGEHTALYTVHIGDDKTESDLGLFEIDGVKKPISVESFDLAEKPNWTEDDYSAAYRMMDTINHVIDAIMSSEKFSIPVEEPVVPNAAQY